MRWRGNSSCWRALPAKEAERDAVERRQQLLASWSASLRCHEATSATLPPPLWCRMAVAGRGSLHPPDLEDAAAAAAAASSTSTAESSTSTTSPPPRRASRPSTLARWWGWGFGIPAIVMAVTIVSFFVGGQGVVVGGVEVVYLPSLRRCHARVAIVAAAAAMCSLAASSISAT
ncbi:Os03g0769201 [Oryza sativa Japonica Group]|uniref:Os03g0769201 protein n=1 Tax=Oryza sativa subsp. japonica TaxID=39947 RepID=A0A0N7KI43_ORYSJ|nr:Os03g0769201 [Oryza sativa Japonica Group]